MMSSPAARGGVVMGGIADDKIQEVRDRVDIVDLIGRYVTLQKAGQNFKGLCPFHQERTPSFNVHPVRKGYKCFGCGASGDGIKFVMEAEGMGFVDAIRKLAGLYGVHLPEAGRGSGAASAQRRAEKDTAYAIMSAATEFYRNALQKEPWAEAGRAYQGQRGIAAEVAETFKLGYAPHPGEAGWDPLTKHLMDAGHEAELLVKLGLAAKSDRTGRLYDRFRGRLMFPVISPGGETLAFSGRILPCHEEPDSERPAPKYVNSPETLLYSKGKALFGLHAARPAMRKKKRAILVEGNVHVVAMHKRGISETVAPLGTAMTSEQAGILARFVPTVILCFDGDDAGRKASGAALPKLLDANLEVRIVMLGDGEDPDSVDPERLAALVQSAGPALEVLMERHAARAGPGIDGRTRALARILPLVQRVKSSFARDLYAERAAELFQFPAARVRAALREKSRQFGSTSGGSMSVSAAVSPVQPLPDGQARLAALLVDVPSLAQAAYEMNVREHITDPRLRKVVDAVLAGVDDNRQPGMSELLELVDAPEQAQLHKRLFSGMYLGPDGAAPPDPEALLRDNLLDCELEALDQEVRRCEAEFRERNALGDVEGAREAQVRKHNLRARQAEVKARLRGAPAAPGETTTH